MKELQSLAFNLKIHVYELPWELTRMNQVLEIIERTGVLTPENQKQLANQAPIYKASVVFIDNSGNFILDSLIKSTYYSATGKSREEAIQKCIECIMKQVEYSNDKMGI